MAFRHSKPWVKINPAGTGTGEKGYEDVMDAVIARGLADYEAGSYVTGIDAVCVEVERRVDARG